MSFLELLRRSRETYESAFQMFVATSAKDPYGIHAFFEGDEDVSIYSGFLHRYVSASRQLHPYKCGNKEAVYLTFNRLTPIARPDSVLLFFVDKDLSDILSEHHASSGNIFVTNVYSIENYIVSENMLQRVWDEFFRFSGVALDFEAVRERFNAELIHLHELLRPIMAWVIFLRQIGHRPNVNNVNLGRVFTLNDDLVLEETNEAKIIGHQAMFEHMCGVVTPPGCQVDIDHIAERLSTLEPKSYIRGKFELWYFVYFISRLAQLSSAAISAEADSGATMKYKAQITENTALYILGPRLDIPPSLDEFLRANLGSPN